MKSLKLKPAKKNLLVRDPETGQPLADKGETKPGNRYWLRRLRDGDVIDMNAPAKTKAVSPKSTGNQE